MKHCRNGWKEKCNIIYDDHNDFEHCPYCGSWMVWTMPYKEFFGGNVGFASNFFGDESNDDILELINELKNTHHVINIQITEIMNWDDEPDDEPDTYSATLIFEVTEETNIDELFLGMHKWKPNEFDKVSRRISHARRPGVYRMWWD